MMPISVCREKKNTEKRRIPKKDKYRKKINTRKKNTGKRKMPGRRISEKRVQKRIYNKVQKSME